MAAYVALLRGVNNIGHTQRVAMSDLRQAFERAGFGEVRTLLNSGNVIFSTPATSRAQLLAQIQSALASELRLTVPVSLLTVREVSAVVDDNPFVEIATNPSHLLIVVPRARSELARLKSLSNRRWTPETLVIGNRAAYAWCANGLPKSPLRIALDRAMGGFGTIRNIATLSKVVAMLTDMSTIPSRRKR